MPGSVNPGSQTRKGTEATVTVPSPLPVRCPTVVGLEELTGGGVEVLQLEVIGALQRHPKAFCVPLLPPQHILREATWACTHISKVQKVNVRLLQQWLLQREVGERRQGSGGSVRKGRRTPGRGEWKHFISKHDQHSLPPSHSTQDISLHHHCPLELPHPKYPQHLFHNQATSRLLRQAPLWLSKWGLHVSGLFPHHNVLCLYPGERNTADRREHRDTQPQRAAAGSESRRPEHWTSALPEQPQSGGCSMTHRPASRACLPTGQPQSSWLLLPWCPSPAFTLC